MAPKSLLAALCMIAIASPVSASRYEPAAAKGAPAGTPETKYCLRTAAVTGTLIERVMCFTRAEWADLGVDLDKEWPREGVRTIA
jgi:hypothetical protein